MMYTDLTPCKSKLIEILICHMKFFTCFSACKINDLCIFLIGLEVDYARSFPSFPAGMIIIRALILLWTGDYPAQHEVGKFIKHGILPCRRDKLRGKLRIFLVV